jgi:hypothetical protein
MEVLGQASSAYRSSTGPQDVQRHELDLVIGSTADRSLRPIRYSYKSYETERRLLSSYLLRVPSKPDIRIPGNRAIIDLYNCTYPHRYPTSARRLHYR